MVTHFPLLLAALLAAEPPASPDGSTQPPTGTERELEGVSPVQLIPRIELRHGFARLQTGGSVHTAITQIDLLLLRRTLLRYELPLRRTTMGGVQSSGVGDMRLQAITLLTSQPRLLAVLITGVELDTASQPGLGTGKDQVIFGGGAAIKPLPWLLPYLIVQEQLSFAGDDSRADVNQLMVRAGTIVFGKALDWYKLDLDTTVDFHDERGRLFGSFEAGSLLIGRVGLFVRGGTQLAGQRRLDYSLEAGARYLFRLGPPR